MPRRDVRSVAARSSAELTKEWDEIAGHRDQLINSGRDISYSHILLPSLRGLVAERLTSGSSLLDVGCGTGTFIAQLAKEFPKLRAVGIDPSPKSIDIAAVRYADLDNCSFTTTAVEEYWAIRENQAGFDIVIANMLLQNVGSLRPALTSCSALLNRNGVFVFAIPHPCFWPRYWQYDEEPWFRYDSETWIDAPFRTSLSPVTRLRTTHTHRSLSAYTNALIDSGLTLESFLEPMPDAGIEGAYPTAWEYPRFLLGRCRRDER